MHTFQGMLHPPAYYWTKKARARVVAVMRNLRQEFESIAAKEQQIRCGAGRKKWGLVIAWFAIRSPVPRSALFLK
jgi:hypothetical protein